MTIDQYLQAILASVDTLAAHKVGYQVESARSAALIAQMGPIDRARLTDTQRPLADEIDRMFEGVHAEVDTDEPAESEPTADKPTTGQPTTQPTDNPSPPEV